MNKEINVFLHFFIDHCTLKRHLEGKCGVNHVLFVEMETLTDCVPICGDCKLEENLYLEVSHHMVT
jgi:hypothetical protein